MRLGSVKDEKDERIGGKRTKGRSERRGDGHLGELRDGRRSKKKVKRKM